jgi:hypothetical protein
MGHDKFNVDEVRKRIIRTDDLSVTIVTYETERYFKRYHSGQLFLKLMLEDVVETYREALSQRTIPLLRASGAYIFHSEIIPLLQREIFSINSLEIPHLSEEVEAFLLTPITRVKMLEFAYINDEARLQRVVNAVLQPACKVQKLFLRYESSDEMVMERIVQVANVKLRAKWEEAQTNRVAKQVILKGGLDPLPEEVVRSVGQFLA